ncbi:conserved hypothetical protein [Vibrio nigripulchritudo SOn1]|uniref:3-demethylubiquinone-9 3-methyltransferase n=1 Tax=Vibrio nigripulchritudo SOn1 TaxID=1238450 RepID=A0AAV2VV41_9VIBR|nr:conserved hypothetical protein [Vibrio nigripulchritudo SOn1]
MEPTISNLRQIFQNKIHNAAVTQSPCSGSATTLSVLTKEELSELENLWVQLILWQKEQH